MQPWAGGSDLPDGTIHGRELYAELLGDRAVRKRAVVPHLQLLLHLQMPILHHVADHRAVAADGDVDGPDGVAETAGEMVRADGMHHPRALACRFPLLLDIIDEDELALL